MKIFVSYVAADRDLGDRLVLDLGKRGFEVTSGFNSLEVGQDYSQQITHAIQISDVYLVLISGQYDKSRHAQYEMSFLLYEREREKAKRILPVVLSKGAALPPFVQHLVYLNAVDLSYDGLLQRIVESLYHIARVSNQSVQNDGSGLQEQFEALKFEQAAEEASHPTNRLIAIMLAGFGAVISIAIGLTFAIVGKRISSDTLKIAVTLLAPVLSFILGFYFNGKIHSEGLEDKREAEMQKGGGK